ncbi:thiol reductant ABC exporter subunit CydC [Rummeliibacillus sp. NPDC094406]|uniref:thiol reductant ABC exporter subunit CydC n=1 Tax=Rummeliibacillus sp. NPDC094406 TaxID=3364511 RepID=UPI00381977F3
MAPKQSNIFKHAWVKPYLQQNKKLLLLVFLLGTMTFICASALMFTSGYLISKSATHPENILLVYVPIVLVRTFGIFRPVFNYAEQLTGHSFVLKILSKMRVRLYQKLETQALTLSNRFSTGNLLGVLADDIEHLQNLYLKTIFPSIFAFILYIIAVVALGFFSIPFALLMALLLFVLVVIIPLVSLLANRKRMIQMKSLRGELYASLTDAVMGLSDWKISGKQQTFLTAYENIEQQQDALEYEMDSLNRRRNLLFQIVVAVVTLVMIAFAGTSANAGEFAHIWIAAFVLVVFPLAEAFAPVSDAVSHLPNYDTSLKRLDAIEEASPESLPSAKEQVMKLKNQPLTITFNDVSFKYDATKQNVLQQITLQFQQGEKIAILGKTGSGKSTLARLILGALTPTEGSVRLNEHDTALIHEDIADIVGVLEQKPHLFDTTVMNNIRLGNVHATDEEVIEAAKKVQMHHYIESLPDGYNTRMQELGERFSGGERQRIALARVLLQDSPIVILDEPTVGLDSITENQLIDTILKTLEGKTIIWITHHLAGVDQMDQVIFIDQGMVHLKGTHKELLSRSTRYKRLYSLDHPMI